MQSRWMKAGCGLAFGLCALAALADPPPWAPAHGYRAKQQYQYRYYRSYQTPIYYAPERGLWFWMSGGNWQAGANLPLALQPYTSGGISITLGNSRPYLQQQYVDEHYGPPQYRGDHHAWDHDEDRGEHEHEHEHGHGHGH